MSIDVSLYLAVRDAMPTCSDCGAANSGNITCRACRQANREACQLHGWNTDHLDKIDEINPVTVAPVGVTEIRRFMGRLGVKA